MPKKNILISTPNYFDTLSYLPYVHALLRTFSEKDPLIKDSYNWLEPIFLNNTAENLLAGREANIDVLGLSCYLWNWPLQIEIAKRVRHANPNCLIVMGGPHPDWADPEFFKKLSFVDIVVKNEGEQPFYQILIENLNSLPNFRQINSLILPDENMMTLHTGAAQRLVNWDNQSVWQSNDIKDLVMKYSGKTKLGAVWETNRGCPYQCKFCDWGSATYTKIRSLPDERLEQDLRFFAENKITKIFIADSNFGMFPRDLDLANRIVHYKEKFGYPRLVYWSTAKNLAEPLVKIAKAFLDHGLDDSVVVGMQSTNENTILEMGRGAHSLRVHKKFSKMIDELGAPKVGQIILGSPGESKDEFINSINELLELNFHRSLFLMNYTVLPNAPISDKQMIQKYEIKTISRPANRIWGHKTTIWKWRLGEETIIVGHNKMTSSDWVTMNLYKTHVMCLHHLGLTRLISRILRNILKMPYAEFYNHLFADALKDTHYVGKQYLDLKLYFENYLINEDAIYATQGIDTDWYIDHESALFCKLIINKEATADWLVKNVQELAAKFNLDQELVNEALNYQINMWITPDYDFNKGRTFESKFDFYTYFLNLKDWDRDTIRLEKVKRKYFVNEKERDLIDYISVFDWNTNGTIDLNKYQNRVIVGAYRRYMSSPIFEKLQILDT